MRHFVLPLMALFMILQSAMGSDLTGFRVCRMTEPAGITRTAQFSWQIVSKKPNVKQTAYRLRAATSKDDLKAGRNLLWDSGRTNSDESVAVPYQGRRLPYQSRVFWQVEVWLSTGEHIDGPVQSFLTGLKQFDSKAQWIGKDEIVNSKSSNSKCYDCPARYLRHSFTVAGKVRRATLYISGMGWGQTFINGKPVSEDVFGTLQTDYTKTVYYNTYDVTSLLRKGNNAIGSVLGNGYVLGFNQNCTSYGLPRLKAQLVIETNKDTMTVVTDTDWKVTTKGPIQSKVDVLNKLFRVSDFVKNESVLVGDTKFDVVGANQAGIDCIGVNWGMGTSDDMLSNGAIKVFDDYKEVIRFLGE